MQNLLVLETNIQNTGFYLDTEIFERYKTTSTRQGRNTNIKKMEVVWLEKNPLTSVQVLIIYVIVQKHKTNLFATDKDFVCQRYLEVKKKIQNLIMPQCLIKLLQQVQPGSLFLLALFQTRHAPRKPQLQYPGDLLNNVCVVHNINEKKKKEKRNWDSKHHKDKLSGFCISYTVLRRKFVLKDSILINVPSDITKWIIQIRITDKVNKRKKKMLVSIWPQYKATILGWMH